LMGQSGSLEAMTFVSLPESVPMRQLSRDQTPIGQKASKRIPAGAAVVAGLLLGAGVIRLAERGLRARESALPHSQPSPSSDAASRPRRITIRIAASPAQAKLFLDGKLLPTNPFDWVAEAVGSQHIVEATAEEHAPASAAVFAEKNSDVSLALSPIASEKTS